MVARCPPSHRQGDTSFPWRVVAGHVPGCRHRPPRSYTGARMVAGGGEKMSKTKLNQIAPGDLVSEFGVDAVRYQLLRDTPLGSDGNFSWEGMLARYNADLATNFGNLLSRVATVVSSKCGGVGPAPSPQSRLAKISEE